MLNSMSACKPPPLGSALSKDLLRIREWFQKPMCRGQRGACCIAAAVLRLGRRSNDDISFSRPRLPFCQNRALGRITPLYPCEFVLEVGGDQLSSQILRTNTAQLGDAGGSRWTLAVAKGHKQGATNRIAEFLGNCAFSSVKRDNLADYHGGGTAAVRLGNFGGLGLLLARHTAEFPLGASAVNARDIPLPVTCPHGAWLTPHSFAFPNRVSAPN